MAGAGDEVGDNGAQLVASLGAWLHPAWRGELGRLCREQSQPGLTVGVETGLKAASLVAFAEPGGRGPGECGRQVGTRQGVAPGERWKGGRSSWLMRRGWEKAESRASRGVC